MVTDVIDVPADADVTPPGRHSVSWRVHADPMMWVAGLRALYLQALHPRVIRGFTENSDYRSDTWQRLIRTARYVGGTTYGSVEEAHRLAAKVRRIHERLSAVDPRTGQRYRLDEPDLLLWVHCCEIDSYLSVVRRAGLRIRDAEADTYVREQRWRAWLVGIDPRSAPASTAELTHYFDSAHSALELTPEARDAARFVMFPPMPWLLNFTVARPGWAGVGGLAYALLPGWARELYRMPGIALPFGATGALRTLRAGVLSVPRPLREGPHLRAARRRLDLARRARTHP